MEEREDTDISEAEEGVPLHHGLPTDAVLSYDHSGYPLRSALQLLVALLLCD
jgi:hypothetical protein